MHRNLGLRAWGAVWVLFCLAGVAGAEVRLPGVFGDHMVLQRDVPLPVWGWADPGEKVTVTLGGQSKSATADNAGKWSLQLAAMKAGGPVEFKAQGKNNAVTFRDVLVGEVWLCSGQSNMAMTVNRVMNQEAEIASADHPEIRMLAVTRKTAKEPQDDCTGQWRVCSPKTVAGFSAAAYFFGRELQKQLKVPVGLIDSSWGGTPIQAWTSTEAHLAAPKLKPMIDDLKRRAETYDPQKAKARYDKQLAEWKKSVAAAKAEGKPPKGRRPRPPQQPELSQGSPATLYNGMIAPLAPYAIRGAIWYQGEANAGSPLYALQMKTLILSWRSDWKQGDFPFLFVQLPNFKAAQQIPSEPVGGWPLIREHFLKTLAAVPNTGMAVTIDIGEADDIHPRNKREAGRRLAQWALAKTYGKDVVACGPLCKSMRTDGNKIVVEFDYAAGGLAARDGAKLKGFAIAGADKKFVWADAKIAGNTVVVSSPEVASPAAVRYAWANNPDCNLVNKAGLPASPFRTDDWTE